MRLRYSIRTGLLTAAAGAVGGAAMPLIEGLDTDYFSLGTVYTAGIGAAALFLIWCLIYPSLRFEIDDESLRDRTGRRVYRALKTGESWAVADGRIWVRRWDGELAPVRGATRWLVNRRDWERLEASLAPQDAAA